MAAMRRLLAILLGSLVLASPAAAAPPGQILAAALKPGLQPQVKTKVRGLVFTKVTCVVPAKSKLIAGNCRAAFSVQRVKLLGVYKVVASINAKGRLGWHTTAVSCTDAVTHKKIPC